jgi:hypothetical protein
MRKILFIIILPFLAACGVKDPSFYDLKSPCVSLGGPEEPCNKISPELNQIYDNLTS